MEVLPSPLGSKAKPMRGAQLNRWPCMQLEGSVIVELALASAPVPLPQCTRPLVIAGSRLVRLSGTGSFAPVFGSMALYCSAPVRGLMLIELAMDWLNAPGTQLYTFWFDV